MKRTFFKTNNILESLARQSLFIVWHWNSQIVHGELPIQIGRDPFQTRQILAADLIIACRKTNKTESKTDMPERQTKPNQQQTYRNNQQSQINNRHVATMNKTESTTHMPQQQTKQDQKQTRCNKLAADQNDVSSQFHYAEPVSTF
jgi:hypothetical protein